MKKGWKVIIPLFMVLSLVLTSCGNKNVSVPEEDVTQVEDTNHGEEVQEEKDFGEVKLPYPQVLEKAGETIGGTLNIGLVTPTPFEGVFNTFLYSNNVDYKLMQPTNGTFMKSGPNHEIVDGGYCNVEFNKDTKTATYKIHKDLTWCDGVPVTVDDIIFVYESIADKAYTGVRFDGDYKNVVGMVEYHEGTADTISGLKKIDDKTLEVSFKEFSPGILWGSGITYNAEPAHYLKDIPLEDMEGHERVRIKPLSCGPFMVSNIVPGESVEYVPNPYWFGEKPKVDKIIYKRTTPDTIVEALKSGTFDLVDEVNVDSYLEYKDLKNITLLSNISETYGYIGFKCGKWDKEKGEVVMDPNKKMSDLKLRQAIGYAMNNEEVAEVFYNNLRIPANALLTPSHATFWNSNQERYDYNPEKAKKILDEAGYIDIDGDGMREDPNGNKLKINLLSMSGGDIAEPLAQFYIQCWNEIGLDVGLQNGRLIEMNAFYDMVKKDNEDIDLFMGAFGTGSNPDPSGLYGRDALFNYSRFATEENDKLLKAIASEDAFGEDGIDNDYLIKAYHDWEKYAHDQAIMIPTHYRITLAAVNNRVSSFDLSIVTDWGWENIGLLSDTPEIAK
ncbi:oligopeptide ABC transporter substrate-binding protein [Tissierella praeacuta]|uniref:oligopeptide ABC transporter substrate-binding protein n=1 Tax=Tissierella praeacuta TaxID=43131 RepID=UPI0033420039